MSEQPSSSRNQNKLAGKVAIVTGGASGIGEATARLFAHHGVRVVIIADINDTLGEQVAASMGPMARFVHCDVSDEDQVRVLVDTTVRTHGTIDIMFSNAGTLSPAEQTVLDLDLTMYDQVLAVNARGMAACVKHAARAMVERGVRGSIVCTGSVSTCGGLTRTDYHMSKHAVLGLVRSASVQLGSYGVRVNCVSPYGLASGLTGHALGMGVGDVEKRFAARMPLKGGKPLRASHVADAVLFLASDDSELITGQNLVIDRGFLLQST